MIFSHRSQHKVQRTKYKALLIDVMSFLNNLIKDPKYQTTEPRRPEEIDDSDVIISPDTRRENRDAARAVAHQEVAGARCARNTGRRSGNLVVFS